jgi:hypothetical protein
VTKPVKHLQYARYLAIHKWYVLRACWRRGLWLAGLTHDLSKLQPSEWQAYADFFYVSRTKATTDAFYAAWNLHQKRNKHHWQYWVFIKDDGAVLTLPMPDRYRREMLADWEGAGIAITGKDDTADYYRLKRHQIKLHPETRAWVDKELGCEPEHQK